VILLTVLSRSAAFEAIKEPTGAYVLLTNHWDELRGVRATALAGIVCIYRGSDYSPTFCSTCT